MLAEIPVFNRDMVKMSNIIHNEDILKKIEHPQRGVYIGAHDLYNLIPKPIIVGTFCAEFYEPFAYIPEDEIYLGGYGVCDSVEQMLALYSRV